MAKTILYLVVAVTTMWTLDGVRINDIFKKNRIIQARIMYLFLTLSITYLVVNFIYDFLSL